MLTFTVVKSTDLTLAIFGNKLRNETGSINHRDKLERKSY